MDYISQKAARGQVLIVNKSHRDTCISSFVLVSGTKGRGRRKGVFGSFALFFLSPGLSELFGPSRPFLSTGSGPWAARIARCSKFGNKPGYCFRRGEGDDCTCGSQAASPGT